MEFIKKLEEIKKEYNNDKSVMENGTVLYGLGKIPNSRFSMFKGLTDDVIQQCIIDAYQNVFPKEYIELLKYTNGAYLFTVRLNTKIHSFAFSLLCIFGLAWIPDFIDYNKKPFDIRVADVERHRNVSPDWLKCATYTDPKDLHTYYDIFIDTTDGKTYSCLKNDYKVVQQWDTLDSALCYMFKTLEDCQTEYEYK